MKHIFVNNRILMHKLYQHPPYKSMLHTPNYHLHPQIQRNGGIKFNTAVSPTEDKVPNRVQAVLGEQF